jgi:hypothetical protein
VRTILAVIGLVAVAGAGSVVLAPGASADERHCYTLGVPGFDHYEYCTFLPVDPGDIIR